MGICASSETSYASTAKLVLHDGGLEEFSYPVKVSYVLQKNPTVFICNSDDMDFDEVVYAIEDDEELLPGNIYFALPLTHLKQRLLAEEMAALAAKASLALTKSGGYKCGRKRSLMLSPEISESPLSPYGDGGRRRSRNSGGCGGSGGRRKRKCSAKLNAIPE